MVSPNMLLSSVVSSEHADRKSNRKESGNQFPHREEEEEENAETLLTPNSYVEEIITVC